MNHPKQRAYLFLLILLLCCICPKKGYAIEDAIIAVVNNELLTLKDLRDYVHSTYVSLVAEGIDDKQIQSLMQEMEKNGINKLIEDKLILSKANKTGLVVREELIDERIKNIQEKYESQQDFVTALIKNGSTLTDLRNKIRDQMKIKYIIDHEVRSKVYVNPQEVTEYYENHKTDYMQKERRNLKSIFIGFNGNEHAASALADKAVEEINAGKGFEQAIEMYSQAPSIGTVEEGQLLPKIERAVFQLKENEVSPPLRVENGIYIFQLTGIRPAQLSELDEVKDKIYDRLFKEKFRKHFVKWLDTLKDKAYIEIKS